MADQNRRALERDAAQGGVESEARLLVARLRSGEISQERLALAAYCGHLAAGVVTGTETPEGSQDLQAWAGGLSDWGQEVLTRAAVAAARLVLPLWEEAGEMWAPFAPRFAIQAAEEAIDCPCSDHRRLAARAAEGVMNGRGRFNSAADAAKAAAETAAAEDMFGTKAISLAREGAKRAVANALTARERAQPADGDWQEARDRESLNVRQVVCADLLPWCNGARDPIKERVAAAAAELETDVIDYAALRSAIVSGVRAALEDLQAQASAQPLRGFALLSDDNAVGFGPVATLSSENAFCPNEWELFGRGDPLGPAQALIEERAASPREGHEEQMRTFAEVVQALHDLEAEGAFGVGPEREELVVMVVSTDPSEELQDLEAEWVELLNPAAVYQRYLAGGS